MKKNTLIGLILAIIVVIWALYIFIQKPTVDNSNPKSTSTGYIKTVDNSKVTAKTTYTPAEDKIISNLYLIQAALAEHFKSPVELKIKEIDNDHASGTATFSGEGAWFLTAKEGDNWVIVQAGNGFVSCETVAPYNFPRSMVSECVDKTGKLIKL